MTDEPKPCPFCGEIPETDGRLVRCYLMPCDARHFKMPYESWQKRPIEDELEARIAELELSSIQIEYMNEDELPADLSDDVYSAMYGCSKIDFVRLFPFVTVDGRKLFLIDLEAK